MKYLLKCFLNFLNILKKFNIISLAVEERVVIIKILKRVSVWCKLINGYYELAFGCFRVVPI